MGLQLSVEQNSGFSVTYWKINEIKVVKNYRGEEDIFEEGVFVELVGYKDKTARDANKRFIDIKRHKFELDNLDLSGSDLRDEVYTKVKALDEWSGCSDIYEDGQS